MCYFHGDFWCTGDANSEDVGCRAIIARGNNPIIASFEYRLVSEVTWQECFNDAEYAMKWTAANAHTLGADTTKGFLIGGAAVGAHLAAICAIRARDRHPHIKLTGQCLTVSTTIASTDYKIPQAWKDRLKSHTEMADAPILNEELYESYVQLLNIPDEEKRKGENFPVWGPSRGSAACIFADGRVRSD
jgi:acetyl esterase/lipase